MTRNEASKAVDPYTSSAALRRAHLDLKQNVSSATAQDMRDFIARACASGAFIHDENERRMAQAIIDYWTTELVSSAGADLADNVPALLAPFNAEQAVHTPEQHFAAEPERDQQARDMIRLAATARLWKNAKNGAGFLLVGDAINQAARYRDMDPDIDQLVNASQKAVTRKRTNYALYSLVSAAVVYFAMLLVFNYLTPFLIMRETKLLPGLADSAEQVSSLRWIARYEQFAPISAISELSMTFIKFAKGTDFRGIQLYGADFVRSEFESSVFQNADLPNSSFIETKIRNTNFSGANLRFSRFKAATIDSTSFAGAKLYRAEFDEARLNDVDFSGADLRLASYRDVEFDVKSEQHFKKVAWWLAVGWSSQNLNKLLSLEADPTAFVKSPEFQTEIENAKQRLGGTKAGTPERALALNYFAWTRATWGIELKGAGDNTPVLTEEECKKRTDVPDTNLPNNALDAALEAVCIVSNLKKEAKTEDANKINSIYANYQDTLGYVYLQIGSPSQPPSKELSEALKSLAEASQVLKDSGGVKFRYSVAQYASGHEKDAMDNLKISMGKEYNYVPSSELQHLKKYIAGSKFLDCVYEFIDNRGSKPSVLNVNSVSVCAR